MPARHFRACLTVSSVILAGLTACAPLQLPPTPAPITATSIEPTTSAPAPAETFTPTLATLTPTYPLPMCTPPPCLSYEVYHCGGACPGGCGTTCATVTPDSGGSARLELEAEKTAFHIGESSFIFVTPVNIGRPHYRVLLKDGQAEFVPAADVTPEERFGSGPIITLHDNASQFLTVSSIQGQQGKLYITIEGRAAGEAQLKVTATGDPLTGENDLGVIESESITLTIAP